MLKLARKSGESIQIGDNNKNTVLDDKHNQVKIGIDAPDDVEIWRDEIYEKIRGTNVDSETTHLKPQF
jgi:carbon storage regulator